MIASVTASSDGRYAAKLVALYVLALVFRLALLVIPVDPRLEDQTDYLTLADNLRTHGVLGEGDIPAARRPPLYPLILASLGNTGTKVLQLIAGSAIAPLTFALASQVLPPAGAIVVGLAMAFAPMSSRYCALFMAETLFTFALVLGSFFWMRRKPVLCGICFGLAILMRAVLLPFILLLPLLAMKRAWRSTLIVSAAALAFVIPWTVRNAIVLHRFVPVASAGWGSNLFQGTLDVPDGDPWPFIMRQRAGDMEGALLRRGARRIRESPGQWLMVRAKQYPKLFLDDGEYIAPWVKPVFWAGDIALLLLAAMGLRVRPGPYIWTYPAFTAVAQLPMWTEARYSLPMVPFLLILAGGTLAAVIRAKARTHSVCPQLQEQHS